MFMTPPAPGNKLEDDPFSRHRQRLLPSNTVSLGGKPMIHSSFSSQQQRIQHLPEILIRDLNMYGVCVLDDFLGEELGQKVLSEVITMYSGGQFTDGQLVKPSSNAGGVRDLKHIRGDKIRWIGGKEPGCDNIGYLVNQVRSAKERGEYFNYFWPFTGGQRHHFGQSNAKQRKTRPLSHSRTHQGK